MQQGKEWRWALEKLTSKKNTGETLTRSLYIPIHITWRKILKVLMSVRISQQSRQTKNPGRKQTNKNNNDLNKQDKFGTPSVGRRFHSPPKNHYCDHFTRKSWRNSCLLLYICSEKLNACSLRKGLGAVLYLHSIVSCIWKYSSKYCLKVEFKFHTNMQRSSSKPQLAKLWTLPESVGATWLTTHTRLHIKQSPTLDLQTTAMLATDKQR